MRIKLFIVFLTSFLPLCVFSYEIKVVNEIYYGLNNVTKEASVISGNFEGNVIIPSSVSCDGSEYVVTSIVGMEAAGSHAFGFYDTPGAFANCYNLHSITIPSSIKSIGSNAFDGCKSLNAVYIFDLSSWCMIDFEDYTGADTSFFLFYDAANPLCFAKDLYLNGSIIVDLVIPEDVCNINKGQFIGGSFKSIIIHENVSNIGYKSFANCNDLKDVYIHSTKIPETNISAFQNSNIENVTLHVPAESVDAYKAASPWKGFKEIVQIVEDQNQKYTLTYMVDGDVYKSYEVKAGSTIIPIDEPTKEGYTFSGWSEIPEEMPAHDVIVTGTFIKDPLGTCAAPTISVVGDKLTFCCETEGVTYHYNVSCSYENSGEGDSVELQAVYNVSVYATKDGYIKSDTVTKEIQIDNAAKGGFNGDINADGVVNAADIVNIMNQMFEGSK